MVAWLAADSVLGPAMWLASWNCFPKLGSCLQQGQSVNMQELDSMHNLCSEAVALALEGHESLRSR